MSWWDKWRDLLGLVVVVALISMCVVVSDGIAECEGAATERFVAEGHDVDTAIYLAQQDCRG